LILQPFPRQLRHVKRREGSHEKYHRFHHGSGPYDPDCLRINMGNIAVGLLETPTSNPSTTPLALSFLRPGHE
jgi:hypothetical protein